MDLSIYLFAFFIFILVVLVVLIIKKVQSADGKESQAVIEKEKKLFKQYQNLEEMILEAEEMIEDAKVKMEEDKKRINTMLEKADSIYSKAQYDDVRGHSVTSEPKIIKKSNVVDMNIKTETSRQKAELNRNQKVIILNKAGKSIEEISKELDISQGEVGLIIGLNR